MYPVTVSAPRALELSGCACDGNNRLIISGSGAQVTTHDPELLCPVLVRGDRLGDRYVYWDTFIFEGFLGNSSWQEVLFGYVPVFVNRLTFSGRLSLPTEV